MFTRSMLSLPALITAASCVPPGVAVRPSSVAPAPHLMAELATIGPAPTIAAELPAIVPQALAPGPAAAAFSAQQTAHDSARSLDCLTAAVYHEARSETEGGQRAVAQVVLNRVRHPAYPASVCGVVYQGSNRRTGCQFSFTCDGSLARRRDPAAWERARGIAADALAGSVYAPVGLATHYHTTAIRPWWAPSLKYAVTVGSHIFYRWRGSWGDPLAFRQAYAGEQGSVAERGTAPVVQLAGADQGGVRVHRGVAAATAAAETETSFGVRIHRGVAADAAPAAGGEAAPIS